MLNFPSFFNAQVGGYEIEQSLRFNNESENVYLSKTFSSDGNRKKWTWSAWIKLGRVSDEGHVFEAYAGSGDIELFMRFNNNDSIRFGQFTTTGYDWKLDTTAKFRDPSAWYHVVLVFDSDNATSSDRARIYVNGERITAFDAATYPASGSNGYVNKSGYPHYLCNSGFATRDFGGYLAEVNFIDGTAVTDALDFGEYDDNGVWRPIKYAGSYTGNSFYLKFDAADVDGDSSGLGNDFTAVNVTTSGTGTDVLSDTPTTNWCTLNPLSFGPSNSDMINGNLRFNTPTSAYGNAKGTIAVSSGKWYWEVTPQTTATANVAGGILGAYETSIAKEPGYYATGFSYFGNGEKSSNSVQTAYAATYGANDVIGTALDLDAGTLVFYKNGVSQGTAFSGLSGTFVPAIGDTSSGSGVQLVCNFGQRDFEYTPPTGFKPLNTANLTAPTVKDGSDYFNTLLYTGTGGTKAVSGAGFQPDFVWIKNRGRTNSSHVLVDAVRGATKVLSSDSTGAEVTTNGTDDFRSFDSDGFTVGDSSNYFVNSIGDTHVAWNWLAGGSGSSNTDGSITSTVSANPSAGFSIVTWTGTGNDDSYGHGLGVKPAMIIHKRRNSTSDWHVWHQGLSTANPTNDVIYLNLADGQNGGNNNLFRQDPTSTVIYTGTAGSHNVSGGTYVDYVFAEVENYSRIGSYVGNGSTDGPFIFTGFTPAFILVKWYANVNTAESWQIYDTKRLTYNPNDAVLYPDSATAEENPADRDVDILSNGFKWRAGGQQMNRSGASYIFAAFAEHPFGGSGISPATAR